jgi:acetyltransferase-like isoleucine patch superfamily enzyme
MENRYKPTGLLSGTTYYFAVKAYDIDDNRSHFSEELVWTKPIPNSPPDIPPRPSGPVSGYLKTEYFFSTSTTDPDNEPGSLQYLFDWGDGSASSWGESTQSHSFAFIGNHCVKAQAKDPKGATSMWSACLDIYIARPTITASAGLNGSISPSGVVTVDPGANQSFTITPNADCHILDVSVDGNSMAARTTYTFTNVRENHTISASFARDNNPPNTPATPSGHSAGYTQTNYSFSTDASDPDGDPMEFLFDWDDGTFSWGGPIQSHSYASIGEDYCVKVQARDSHDATSGWSGCHYIDITAANTAPPPITTDDLQVDGSGIGTRVALDWTAYQDKEQNEGDIAEYRVYVSDQVFTQVTGLPPVAMLPPGTFLHTVENLIKGKPYYFAVVAVDTSGSMNAAVTPTAAVPADTIPPEEVRNLQAASFDSRLVFTWTAPVNTYGDLAGYLVYFGGAIDPIMLPADQTQFEKAGLMPATGYAFKIVTVDLDGNQSAGLTITGITWLDNPAGLNAQAASGHVDLTWVAVQPAEYVQHYNVYVSTSDFSSIEGMTANQTVTSTFATLDNLNLGVTNYIAVTAVNLSGGERKEVVTVSIREDPPPTISINDVTVGESDGTVSFTVSLSGPSAMQVSVDFASNDDTATGGSDYAAVAGTLIFEPGETSKPVLVHILDDALDELAETFSVVLAGPENAAIADGQGVARITDNDPPPTISINDVTVGESDGTALFTVSLTGPSAMQVSVDYATADGTATAGGDYGAAGGTLTFTPGQTTQTVSVPIIDDALYESAETFVVNLSSGVKATITDGQGIGTILKDTDLPVAAADSYTTDEDVPLNVSAPGVRANDSNVENEALSAILIIGPVHGTLALNADGSFAYTPDAGFNGADSFTYKISAGVLASNTAKVTITVNCFDDTDGDGICNSADADDDNDGVDDGLDSAPLDRFQCRDADGDGCDDCVSGTADPAADGMDTDADGACDAGDLDDDNDGVEDASDAAPLDKFHCRDADGDTCDDCSSGTAKPAVDGLDTDSDGLCDAGDPDDDNDGVPDSEDSDSLDPFSCQDLDGDTCDDCSSGTDSPANDGPDADADSLCDAGDPCPDDPDNDVDEDGHCGDADNCPSVSNPDQRQTGNNAGGLYGDACVDPGVDLSHVDMGDNAVIEEGTTFEDDVVIGDDAQIGSDVKFKDKVTAGDHVDIADNAVIKESTTLGDNVVLGYKVKLDENVVIDGNVEIGDETAVKKKAVIKEGAIIGSHVTIEALARIGIGAIIGDGAKIEKEAVVPDFAVIPAGATVSP